MRPAGRSARWPGAAAVVAVLVAVAAWRLGGAGDEGARVDLTREFVARHSGVAARYPAGWHATARNETFVDNPAHCFAVYRAAGPDGPGIEVKLVEYLPPELDRRALDERSTPAFRREFPPRPAHFRIGMLRPGDNSWTDGGTMPFQERRRAFFVGVAPAQEPDARARRAVEAIVDSIRIGKGRCRPSAGVGSAAP